MSSLEKATITNTVTGDRIPVLFNPEEYTFKKAVNYAQAAVPGLRAPILQFGHGDLGTLQMELLVDTYEAHGPKNNRKNQAGEDVRNLTSKITDLMNIDSATHAPPVLLFTWGPSSPSSAPLFPALSFTCVLSEVSQRFTLFLPDGTPVRARLQVTFSEFTNAEIEAKEIKRETADYSHLHVVREGETLSAIAGQVYRDPSMWRPIALYNQVEDPHSLPVGTRLLIPQLPFLDPETGEVMR